MTRPGGLRDPSLPPRDRAAAGIRLQPGTLPEAVRRRSAEARARGALHTLPARSEIVRDAGVDFIVRVGTGPSWKKAPRGSRRARGRNPFLPYEEALFVAEVSDTHVCLLNKYNVVDHHLLLVTRHFEDQELPLTLRDFEALLVCMAELDSLGFYNSSPEAGASQRHRHLQMVPVPLAPQAGSGARPPSVPVEPLLEGALRPDGRPARASALPFRHAVTPLDPGALNDPVRAAGDAFEAYRRALRALGREGDPGAYNLLMTSRWLLVVPRRRETHAGVSVNALGYAGALLVRDEEQLAELRRRGPLAILRSVAEA